MARQAGMAAGGQTLVRGCAWLAIGATLVGATAYVASAAERRDEVSVRRLTQEQYRRSIADVFGDDIKITARLEPDPRREGLIAIGVSQATVSASGFEQYDAAAREIAGQVTDAAHRDALVGCRPANPAQADEACARSFLSRVGRLLYRRPLAPAETDRFVAIARQGAAAKTSFYDGLAISLATLLESPPFVFRIERAAWRDGGYRLDDYSAASRLSFLLWNAPPDAALLSAAEAGDLRTAQGLKNQVDRMLASPRYEQGVRAFFSDMLALNDLDVLQKDPTIYPRFSARLAADAREQTLRTIVDTLVRRDEDYRELFTTRRTFLSRSLGMLYSIPVVSQGGWEAHTFAADDPRAGLLAQPAFLMAHSHPGRSSATLRGKAIRELILCQTVPAPPPNVDFAIVQNVQDPRFATARQRIAAHNTDPTCSGCHKLTDPLGLPLENFDGGAGLRTTENGAPIDTSGEIDGQSFAGAPGLGKTLAGHPALGSCLVNRIYAYGVGRTADTDASAWLEALQARQATDGLKLRNLMRAIALSDQFYRPAAAAPDGAKVAARAPLVRTPQKEPSYGS